jgi:hypothetical protein
VKNIKNEGVPLNIDIFNVNVMTPSDKYIHMFCIDGYMITLHNAKLNDTIQNNHSSS